MLFPIKQEAGQLKWSNSMKTILFTQRVEIVESYGERRDCADQRIAEFFCACGYLPVAVPNQETIACQLLEKATPAGIVFTGGNSLVSYGGDAPERDQTERQLLEIALEKNIPVYGFCRGMQVILDYFGEGLEKVEGHIAVKHRIEGTFENRIVNSFHSLAVKEIKQPMIEVLARSEDGVVEAATVRGKRALMTMWHPERMSPFEERDIRMVRSFFEEERIEL